MDVLWHLLLLTYCKSQAESYISNRIHTSINRHVPQVHQVTHYRHHRGIHHACNTIIMLLPDQSLHTFIGGISTRSNLTNGKTNTKVRKNQTIDVSSKGNLEQTNDHFNE